MDYTGLEVKWLVDDLLCTDVIGTPKLKLNFIYRTLTYMALNVSSVLLIAHLFEIIKRKGVSSFSFLSTSSVNRLCMIGCRIPIKQYCKFSW